MMWTAGWGWVTMVLVMVLFWGGVIALVAFASRRPDSRYDPRMPPLQILEERFARGEISADELTEGKRLLESGKGRGSGRRS